MKYNSIIISGGAIGCPFSTDARYSSTASLLNKYVDIVSKLENKDVISNIEEVNNGVNVYIGHDSNIADDVTVIKTKYNINGEEGTLAVIGPKRMEYDKVVGILDYIKKEIEKK